MNHRRIISALAAALLITLIVPASADAQRRGGRLGGALRNAVGAPEVTETQIVPSAVHANFAHYDEENPLEDAGVTYATFGIANYDSFFSDVANVQAALNLSQHTVELANGMLDGGLVDQVFSGSLFTDSLGTAVAIPAESRQAVVMSLITGDFSTAGASTSGMTEAQFNTVREQFFTQYPDTLVLRDTLPASVDALAELPDRVASLSTTAPTLVTEAPDTFTGPQAMNLPRVTTELTQASRSIADMPGQIGDISVSLSNLFRTQQ